MQRSILYVTPFFPPYDVGGMEISLKLLAEELAHQKWDVTIATPGYGLTQTKIEGTNPRILYIPWPKESRPSDLLRPQRLRQFTAEVIAKIQKPDIIDCYSWPQPGVILKRHWNIPLVVSVRDATFISDMRASERPTRLTPHRYFQERFRVYGYHPKQAAYGLVGLWRNTSNWKALQQANHITYASQALKDLFADLAIPGTPIYSIANVTTSKLPDVSIPGRNNKLPLIAYVGRLGVGKGAKFLYEAMGELLEEGTQLQCVFVGKGELETEFRKTKYPHNILVTGRMPRGETVEIMRQATTTVIPSIIFEGFPRAAIESLSVGTPVIGTKVGGIPEAVGDAGLTVPGGDIPALKKAILTMITDQTVYQGLKAATEKECDKYTPEATAKRVTPIYLSLLPAKEPA